MSTDKAALTLSQKIVEGIQILAKYPDCHFVAEHDEIWFGPEAESLVTSEDCRALEALGWNFKMGEGWHRWV